MKKKRIILALVLVIILILSGVVTYILLNRNEEKIEVTYNIPEREYEYFILYNNEKYGVIDINGEIIIQPNYDRIIIPNPKKAVFICSNNDSKNVVLDEKSKQIFTIYDNVEPIAINGIITSLPYEKDILKYEVNGQYGLIDMQGKRISKAIYEDINGLKYKEGELVAKKDGKYGVIDINGKTIINFDYDNIEADKYYVEKIGYKNSGYIVCNKTDEGYRYGYISNNGKKILNTEFNNIQRITELTDDTNIYLIASVNGQYGLLKNSEKIIDYRYQGIEYNEQNNLLIMNRATRYGVYTLSGEEVVPLEYKTLLFNGIYIYAKNGNDIKYFTNRGEEVTTEFTTLQPIKNGEYYISINEYGLYGVIDKNENTIVENKYVLIEYLFNNYLLAYKNEAGREIIELGKGIVKEFNNQTILNKIGQSNLIKAEDMQNNKIAIYDDKMQLIINLNDAQLDIRDTYIKLYNENTIMYFDMSGNRISEFDAYNSSEEAPDKIGEYRKEYFGYSQIYYTKD